MPGTPGNPPSGDLVQTFEDAIATFNDAINTKKYDNFRQYLYPSDTLYIQKVDDPGGFKKGDPDDIIDYLSTEEAKTALFPQFDYHKPPHKKEHTNKKNT